MADSYRMIFEGGPLDNCIIENITRDNPPITSLSICVDPSQERFIYYEPEVSEHTSLDEYVMIVTQDDHVDNVDVPDDDDTPSVGEDEDDNEDYDTEV